MEEKIFMARVAEQCERYDDMVEFLRPILKEKGGDFSVEERNLLSVGFKNLIGGCIRKTRGNPTVYLMIRI